MLALVVALMAEARPLIDYFHLKEVMGIKGYRIWKKEEMLLILSGTGKLFSAAATSFLLGKYPEITQMVNVGICGHAHLSLGSLIMANKIIDSSENRSFYPTMIISPPCTTLTVICLLKPSQEYREESCFDMESAGFFPAASKFLPAECIQVLKVISDNATSHLPPREKMVSSFISAQCSSLEKIFFDLKSVTHTLLQTTPDASRYLEQWHFTHAEKEKLADILYRIDVLRPKEEHTELLGCKTAADFLLRLEEKAKKLPLFLSRKKIHS